MQHLTIFLLISVAVLACVSLSGCGDEKGDSQTDTENKYEPRVCVLGYESGGCWDLEVLVNGIPVICGKKGGGTIPVSYLVVDGKNHVQITAELIKEDFFKTPLKVQMFWPSNHHIASRDTIFQLEEEYGDIGQKVSKDFSFDVALPFTRKWQASPQISHLSDQDREDILSEIGKVCVALKEKNVDQYLELTDVAVKDAAQYRNVDSDIITGEIRERYGTLFSNSAYAPVMREEENIQIEPCGSVVLVTGKRDNDDIWKTAVIRLIYTRETFSETSHKSTTIGLKRFGFSKIDGKWRIVIVDGY